MKKIPVNRNIKDDFYRYKMQALQIKKEGKTQKIVLINLNEIAKDLKRNPSIILKYFSIELGTQAKSEKGAYKINGNFSLELLQSLIYDFIDKYVLCAQCNNPETFFLEDKNGNLIRECYACGYKSMTDNKLKSIILKEIESNTSEYYVKKGVFECVIQTEVTHDLYIRTDDFLNELHSFKEKNENEILLPSLEYFLIEKEIENEVCFYLDVLIKESLIKKSDIFKYFQNKSKVIDKHSSKKIRRFLESYFE
ncbi:eukaryotic translation initiation factor 5 [Tubulinosema ratisbonensis]|uniref:Eukaryotic translation initiation factor 5 n=1 Tax=Tubulinosema ratisbonensis TaxID=291195 RepID=A0A437AKL8_9MICR|nr:eukaryotic translation initiation factor 5 [Tubulinosema ratisbonensis]